MSAAAPFPILTATGRPAKPRKGSSDAPVCAVEYPHIAAGIYTMRCIEAKAYFDPQFRRHVCRLAFMDPNTGDGASIYGFINLGRGESPKAGRRSRYWKAWTMANGAPARRGQTMTPKIFYGRWFRVEVADVTQNTEKKAHGQPEIYSTVREILELAHA